MPGQGKEKEEEGEQEGRLLKAFWAEDVRKNPARAGEKSSQSAVLVH